MIFQPIKRQLSMLLDLESTKPSFLSDDQVSYVLVCTMYQVFCHCNDMSDCHGVGAQWLSWWIGCPLTLTPTGHLLTCPWKKH